MSNAIPPPPRTVPTPTPDQLLGAAKTVLTNDEPVLDGRRAVTVAALARQATENAIDRWLAAAGTRTRGGTRRDDFLCLVALHPEPALARELHNVWARLSDACHATSYDLPPTGDELQRWMAVIQRFITTTDRTGR